LGGRATSYAEPGRVSDIETSGALLSLWRRCNEDRWKFNLADKLKELKLLLNGTKMREMEQMLLHIQITGTKL